MAQVTWTNVGGDAVTNAAQQSAAQTQQGADLIQSGLNTLIGMSKDKTERNLTVYNNIAERNLQKELNAISGITDADEILEFQVDQDALREDYGFQLGGLGKSEESVDLLRKAADQRFNELVQREEAVDVRNSRLDDKANEEIFAEYRALPDNQNKTLQELKDGWEDHVAGLDDDRRRGKDIVYWGKARFQNYSAAEEGLTEGTIQINSLDKADYESLANAYELKVQQEKFAYEHIYENGAKHTSMDASSIESYIMDKLNSSGLKDKGVFSNSMAAAEQVQALTNTMLDVFNDQSESLRSTAIKNLEKEITAAKEKRNLAKPGSKEWRAADKEMVDAENTLEGFIKDKDAKLVMTKELLDEIFTITNVYDSEANVSWIWTRDPTDPEVFKKKVKSYWNTNEKDLIGRISKIYANQAGSRASAASILYNSEEQAKYQMYADKIVTEASRRDKVKR